MKIAGQYGAGEKGKRALDAFPMALGTLVTAMEETRRDILGDIFQGAITRGQGGQFFTPQNVCDLMAKMTMDAEVHTVRDPCCGSGRLLLAAAEVNRSAEFYGQDIDLRCVQMTAINLGLNNLYGYAIHGDSLGGEQRLIYRTGFNGKGVITEIEIEQAPEPVKQIIAEVRRAGSQLSLF